MSTRQHFALSNARIVGPDGIRHGSLRVVGGLIDSIDESERGDGEDCGGDYLIPGLVELHTDHLESHCAPRPGVRWNSMAAIQSHDAQIATSGITTVLDCLRMGANDASDYQPGEMHLLASDLQTARYQNRLRSEHYLHLRCEVSSPNVLADFEQFDSHPDVRMISMMDHAPGQRQFRDIKVFERYHRNKNGLDDASFAAFAAQRLENSQRYSDKHRHIIAEDAKRRNLALASHDDATLEHVAESHAFGVHVSEFPTTIEAATAAHQQGMQVLMGAPNVVRGKSHSGNVSGCELAQKNILDILSSDYVPSSLLLAAFALSMEKKLMSLSEAIALVSLHPAHAIGLYDRGQLATGLKADMVRVTYSDNVPTVKSVWRNGVRVA